MAEKILHTKVSNKRRSPVDIIIPFHGQHGKVIRLVESILIHCRSNPYLITLVDDGSPNKEFLSLIKSVPQVRVIRNVKQEGFGAALYKGYMATQQPWVLFMHSDCVVEDGNWMLRLWESLNKLKTSGVKLISSKCNNPISGDERLLGEKGVVDEDIVLSNTFVPLYSAMCHRDLFKYIGGFIKAYPYAYGEDEELGYRMRFFGFKQAICGNSWVYHEGGGTINELLIQKPNLKKIIDSNKEKCVEDMKKIGTPK